MSSSEVEIGGRCGVATLGCCCSCGKTCHATFPEVMKTDRNRDKHTHTQKLFTVKYTTPICGTEDWARLHFSCSCLSPLLTQMYCKEIAAQIAMRVRVNVAPGGKLVWKGNNTQSFCTRFSLISFMWHIWEALVDSTTRGVFCWWNTDSGLKD